MSSHQDRICVWIFVHGNFEALGEIFLASHLLSLTQPRRRLADVLRCVLNDRHSQPVEVA